MGNMDVISLGSWQKEKIQRLPRHQEVLAVIVSADVVSVGDSGGQDLELVFTVVSGASKGRRIVQHVPLWDQDGDRAVNGRAILNALCRALCIDIPTDSSAFVGRALALRLTRRRGSEDRPSAQYLPCNDSDRRAWERWAEHEIEQLDVQAPQQKSQVGKSSAIDGNKRAPAVTGHAQS